MVSPCADTTRLSTFALFSILSARPPASVGGNGNPVDFPNTDFQIRGQLVRRKPGVFGKKPCKAGYSYS
jgi:hypothetical protein